MTGQSRGDDAMPRFADRAIASPAQTGTARAAPKRAPHPARSPLSYILQLRAAKAARAERGPTATNAAGLPAALKAGVERLSGIAMDDVRVHRDSAEPAKLGARAYAKGGDIHLGPGQERHLPHEAWHVVQQRQGRVAARTQLKGVAIYDYPGLEREADAMGARAASEGLRTDYEATMIADAGEAPVQRSVVIQLLADPRLR